MFNNYDYKNIIKKIIIGVGIAFILFNVNKCNARALVYKGYEYTTNWDTTATKSCNGNSCQLDFYLESPLDFDTDYIGIKLSNFAFTDNWNLNVNQYTEYCSSWRINSTSTTQQGDQEYYYTTLSCQTTTTIGGGQDTLSNNNIMISAKSYNDNWAGSPCWLDSEFQDTFICPVQSNRFWFIRIFITGGSNDSYAITLDRVKLLLNNDSTEIINGLNGIQSQQQQTNTIIQDSNVSGASSTGSNSFSSMNSSISQQADSLGGISTYNGIAQSFVTQLSTTTCQAITLPFPFVDNQTITLPCVGNMLQTEVPVLWTFWRMLCAGIVGITIWKALINFIKNTLDPYHIGAQNLPIGGGK